MYILDPNSKLFRPVSILHSGKKSEPTSKLGQSLELRFCHKPGGGTTFQDLGSST